MGTSICAMMAFCTVSFGGPRPREWERRWISWTSSFHPGHGSYIRTGYTWAHGIHGIDTVLSRSSAMQDRDYLVPKPQPNLMGFRKSMVKYPDALIMGRALLRELPLHLEAQDGGQVRADGRLIDLEAVGFWSEHSERGSMDTWMQLAKVPKEIRCMLGRWATSNEEGYLRHLEASVCGAQVKVAEMLRSPPTAELAAHEDEVVKKLSRYLEGRGMDQSRINRQVFRLQSSLREETLEVSTGSNPPLDDLANLGAGIGREVAVSSGVDTDDVSMDEMSAEGDLGPDHCMGDYVFSILGTSKRRTLHRIGECWRLPGTHYRNYIW